MTSASAQCRRRRCRGGATAAAGLQTVAFADLVARRPLALAAVERALRTSGACVLRGDAESRRVADAAHAQLRGFFSGASGAAKAACGGGAIYADPETGLPLWRVGYEQRVEARRETYRRAKRVAAPPAPSPEFAAALAACEAACAAAASAALAACCPAAASREDDSVTYAMHYPRLARSDDPSLQRLEADGSCWSVAEHADGGWLVVEPVADVAALQLRDGVTGRWITAEAAAEPGDFFLLVGRALGAEAGYPPCVHRVTPVVALDPGASGPAERVALIHELKLV